MESTERLGSQEVGSKKGRSYAGKLELFPKSSIGEIRKFKLKESWRLTKGIVWGLRKVAARGDRESGEIRKSRKVAKVDVDAEGIFLKKKAKLFPKVKVKRISKAVGKREVVARSLKVLGDRKNIYRSLFFLTREGGRL